MVADMAKKLPAGKQVYSAFILSDDQTWEQPSFRISRPATEHEIEQALMRKFGGFTVYGLSEDDDAPDEYVQKVTIR